MENQTTRTPEAEIEDFATLFEASQQTGGPIEEGKVVSGTVIQLTKDYAVVDIGYKSEGQVPLSEFVPMPGGEPAVKVGDKVEVLVESRENDTGMVVLSKEKADKMRIWDEISAACERDELVEGIIVGRVKGGLSVDIGVKAFLPGSQVDIRPVRNLDKLIGEKFKFKVIKFNKKRGNIVLSRRVLLEKEREELKKETLKNLKEGAILKGVVKNLTDYGAFIDLGGIDGLLHITDMSLGPHRPPVRDVRGRRGGPRRRPQVRPRQRARQPRPQADPGGPVAPRRREVPGRHARQGQGRLAHRLRRLHRARAGRRGPGPRLRDELDQARQAPLEAAQGRPSRSRRSSSTSTRRPSASASA